MDMALALVEEDVGSAVALQVARELVLYLRRPGGRGAHAVDATNLHADWFDGAHAVDPASLWDDPRLNARRRSATVRPMSPPARSGRAVPQRSRREHRDARRRRLAVLIAIGVIALGTLLVTAFGGGDHPSTIGSSPASASRLLPAGPPIPKVLARIGAPFATPIRPKRSRRTSHGLVSLRESATISLPIARLASEIASR